MFAPLYLSKKGSRTPLPQKKGTRTPLPQQQKVPLYLRKKRKMLVPLYLSRKRYLYPSTSAKKGIVLVPPYFSKKKYSYSSTSTKKCTCIPPCTVACYVFRSLPHPHPRLVHGAEEAAQDARDDCQCHRHGVVPRIVVMAKHDKHSRYDKRADHKIGKPVLV